MTLPKPPQRITTGFAFSDVDRAIREGIADREFGLRGSTPVTGGRSAGFRGLSAPPRAESRRVGLGRLPRNPAETVPMSRTVSTRPRVIATFLIVIAAAVLAYQIFSATGSQALDQSSFYEAVIEGRGKEVTMVPNSQANRVRNGEKS